MKKLLVVSVLTAGMFLLGSVTPARAITFYKRDKNGVLRPIKKGQPHNTGVAGGRRGKRTKKK